MAEYRKSGTSAPRSRSPRKVSKSRSTGVHAGVVGFGLAMLAFAGYSVVTAAGPKTTAALAGAQTAAARALADSRPHPILVTHVNVRTENAERAFQTASIPATRSIEPTVGSMPRLAPPTATHIAAAPGKSHDGASIPEGMRIVSLERGARVTPPSSAKAARPVLTAKAGRAPSMASAGAFDLADARAARPGVPGSITASLLPKKKLGEAEFSRQAAATEGLAEAADRKPAAIELAALETDAADAGLASAAPAAASARAAMSAIPLPGERPDEPASRELAMADPAQGGTAALEARFGAVLKAPEAQDDVSAADAEQDSPADDLGAVPLPTHRPKVTAPAVPAPAPAAAREIARTKPATAQASASTIPDKPQKPKRRAPWSLLAYAPTVDPDMQSDAPRVGRVALPGHGSGIAVYDIDAATVYMPNGERLEAHSGLGYMVDEPRYVKAKNRGPTPPNVYNLRMRESLFHGVEAVRLLPADGRNKFNRDGLLAHSYMLRGRGQSNGCVVFANYPRFLKAFKRGEVRQMIVVARMSDLPRQLASLR